MSSAKISLYHTHVHNEIKLKIKGFMAAEMCGLPLRSSDRGENISAVTVRCLYCMSHGRDITEELPDSFCWHDVLLAPSTGKAVKCEPIFKPMVFV